MRDAELGMRSKGMRRRGPAVFGIPSSEFRVAHYFLCRIFERMRRFLRPTLRRPVPRRRPAMSRLLTRKIPTGVPLWGRSDFTTGVWPDK